MQRFIKDCIVIFLFVIPLLLAGCTSENKANIDQDNNNKIQAENITRELMKIESDDLVEGVIDDLKVGAKILVVGNENTDGSIIATQIIKGENFEDFSGLGGNMMQDRNMGTSTRERIATSSDEQRFNPEQFQNMSDEDRAKLRENMVGARGNTNLSEADRASFMEGRTNRQVTDGAPVNRARSSRTSGEVIDIGDGIITVKLEAGGSKLVFFSDSTNIFVLGGNITEEKNNQ